MPDNQSNNKRIAKNTIFLYIRMLLIMVVSLYTSRVVLQILGTEDFGTYNIVGGVVVMFTFISNAMASGTQRHLSYELGKENNNLPEIFSACFKVHVYISLIIFLLAETIGLWFLNYKMNFPEGRMGVVNWIYQFSIISCILNIVKTPYNAAIISYEKMSFFAYTSIVEVILRLIIVYLLLVIPLDKLFSYGVLVMVVTVVMLLWYAFFCHRRLNGICIVHVKDNQIYKRILSFSGWALFGSVANVGYQQGLSIVVNLFFGVALNAAIGIANQVNGAVRQLVAGFQQALNPQLTQAEAAKDRARQSDLIFKSSKYSFIIMFVLVYPLMSNINYILSLWLGSNVPDHTATLCGLLLISAMFESLGGPLWVTIFATGNIKWYQITVSIACLLVLPIVYFGGRLGMTPEQMFIVRALSEVVVLILRLYYIMKYTTVNIKSYCMEILLPLAFLTSISIIIYLLIESQINEAVSVISLLVQSSIYVSIAGLLSWFVALSKTERTGFVKLLKKKF